MRDASGTPGPERAVLLAWALDRDGRRACASDLDAATRRARAPFRCLGCGEVLFPHLGPMRAPHFAHRPGTRCPLASPETALHFDAKERLLALCEEAFAGRRRVALEARCSICRQALPPLDLAALGDAAAPEGVLPGLRADVLVMRRGRPALAFEVCVTHAVGEQKERALAALGLPAVEIDACSEWERDRPQGTAIVCVHSLGLSPCGPCQAGARAEAGRALGGEEAARAELESYRARGLFGPEPGPAIAHVPPLSDADRAALAVEFDCRHCGGRALQVGVRLARHACPGTAPRAVAWRGYDGTLVVLSWWRRG